TVHRHGKSIGKGRRIEGGRKMRKMMFDMFDLTTKSFLRERASKFVMHIVPFRPIPQALEHKLQIRTMRSHVGDLARQICSIVAVHRDVAHVCKAQSCFLQTISDGMAGKAGPMFDAPKALLLCSGDEVAFAEKAGRRVWVVGVDSENDHNRPLYRFDPPS